MVTAVGLSAYGLSPQFTSGSTSGSSGVAALQGRIRQDQLQLNDWTTCVSAKTTKGQSAIQKLSGEISADKEQVARALQAQSGARFPACAASATDAPNSTAAPGPGASGSSRARSVDIWV
jgi:hypothetical protein